MKPILFNSKMVMAILEGRKTVTRRLMKPQPKSSVTQLHKIPKGQLFPGYFGSMERDAVYKPPFREGDILYVRETWGRYTNDGYFVHKAGWKPEKTIFGPTEPPKWHPSIHMPKEAARIFLRVTRVSAQPLQWCGNAQAKDEGCTCCAQFARVWDSTIKPADRDTYGWNANPWVWVIEFERCEKEDSDD